MDELKTTISSLLQSPERYQTLLADALQAKQTAIAGLMAKLGLNPPD